jgi:HlyD family secretion protein
VKAGDTLAVIDIPEVEAKLKQTKGTVISAKAQYQMSLNGATVFERQQIQEKYNAAKELNDLAEKSYKRIKNMADDSLIAQQKYDEVYEQYQSATAQLKAIESQKKDIENGVRKEKIEMAEGDMDRAEGAFDEANSAIKERYITAPTDMVIETIALHKGELALAGYNFCIGYNTDDVFFRFTIGERDLSRFSNGQVYKIILPYKNEKLIESKLVSIKDIGGYAKKTASYPNYELGESTYELKFVPINKSDAEQLFTNMTVLINK